jgi:hypothetical protein
MVVVGRIRFICGHMLKNRFGEFNLRAHKFFNYFVKQWLAIKNLLLSSGAVTVGVIEVIMQ